MRCRLITITLIKKKDKNNAIFSKTIKQQVNSKLYKNIIGKHNQNISLKTF